MHKKNRSSPCASLSSLFPCSGGTQYLQTEVIRLVTGWSHNKRLFLWAGSCTLERMSSGRNSKNFLRLSKWSLWFVVAESYWPITLKYGEKKSLCREKEKQLLSWNPQSTIRPRLSRLSALIYLFIEINWNVASTRTALAERDMQMLIVIQCQCLRYINQKAWSINSRLQSNVLSLKEMENLPSYLVKNLKNSR